MSGEKKYYLANPPAETELRTLAVTIKARCICAQARLPRRGSKATKAGFCI